MPSIEQASRWNQQLRALCATLPPAQDRTADEYTTVLRRLDTNRQTAATAVVLVPDGVEFPGLYRLADQLGAETVRRRWLLALNDVLLRTAAAAVDEADRRGAEADEGDLGFARSFAEGARFVLNSLREVMDTDNDADHGVRTIEPVGAVFASGVDAGPGMIPGTVRAMAPEREEQDRD